MEGDSVRSFESAYSQLEDKMQEATEKHKAFGRREKWLTGAAGGLSLVGTGGFILSSAIPEAKRQQQAATMRKLKQVVAEANERAAAAGGVISTNTGIGTAGSTATGQQVNRIKVKRSAAEVLEDAAKALAEHKEEDAESFKSALSRTSSMRIGDFEDDVKHVDTPPRSPSRASDASASTQTEHDRLLQDNIDTHDRLSVVDNRLSAIETALLDVRQHQHEQVKLSPFTKIMIGMVLLNAMGGVVSAELSAQGSIESSRGLGPMPDVKNLDAQTCAQYAKKLDGLNCDAARGKAVAA